MLQEEEGGRGDRQPGLCLGLGVVSALHSCLDESCRAHIPVKAIHLVDLFYLGLIDCDAGAPVFLLHTPAHEDGVACLAPVEAHVDHLIKPGIHLRLTDF